MDAPAVETTSGGPAFGGRHHLGSGMGLMMTSAYIISAAALHPSIAVLQVAIVGIGVSQAGAWPAISSGWFPIISISPC